MKKGIFTAFAIFEPKKAPAECLLYTGDNFEEAKNFLGDTSGGNYVIQDGKTIIANSPDNSYPAMFIEPDMVLIRPTSQNINGSSVNDHSVGAMPKPFFEAHYVGVETVKKVYKLTDLKVVTQVFQGDIDLKEFLPKQK
jgi:hypothetical protein